jgi:hypothetical protein
MDHITDITVRGELGREDGAVLKSLMQHLALKTARRADRTKSRFPDISGPTRATTGQPSIFAMSEANVSEVLFDTVNPQSERDAQVLGGSGGRHAPNDSGVPLRVGHRQAARRKIGTEDARRDESTHEQTPQTRTKKQANRRMRTSAGVDDAVNTNHGLRERGRDDEEIEDATFAGRFLGSGDAASNEIQPAGLLQLLGSRVPISGHHPRPPQSGEKAGGALQQVEAPPRKPFAAPEVARNQVQSTSAHGANPSGLDTRPKFSMFSGNAR